MKPRPLLPMQHTSKLSPCDSHSRIFDSAMRRTLVFRPPHRPLSAVTTMMPTFLEVSRVGGAAQTKVIKKLGGGVRLALAQYRELAAFAQFASDLDEATRKQLERGRMVTELMKQPQYQPLQVWEMALTLFAVNNGYYDDIEVKKALAAEKSMRDHLKSKFPIIVKSMEEKKDLSAEDEKALHDAIGDWKKHGTF